MRLIDADALYKHKVYAETPEISGDFIPGFVIDKAPTIDAVPVVRCRECKYWGFEGVRGETEHVKHCFVFRFMAHENEYCSMAERSRKKEEQNEPE